MRRKSAFELAAIWEAARAIHTARRVMLAALKSGAGVTEVVLAGELAANAEGAQDVRTLFSLDGGRTLQPFAGRRGERPSPMIFYLAVRRFNYWAERFPIFSTRPEPSRIHEKALGTMRLAAGGIRAGTPAREIESLIADSIAPYRPHPLTARAFAQRMGIALDQPPRTEIGPTFEDGEVYSVRVGATDGERQHIICSEMIHLDPDGVELLDPAPD
jgi:hypothetical protein